MQTRVLQILWVGENAFRVSEHFLRRYDYRISEDRETSYPHLASPMPWWNKMDGEEENAAKKCQQSLHQEFQVPKMEESSPIEAVRFVREFPSLPKTAENNLLLQNATAQIGVFQVLKPTKPTRRMGSHGCLLSPKDL